MAEKIWKTLKLGTYEDTSALRKTLQEAGCRVSRWADDILGKIELAQEETEADLVIRLVAELGFENGARYDAICARAKELGLKMCPAEVGPQLRLQYLDQPIGEWLIIAMEPITDSDGDPDVFHVDRIFDALWLSAYYGYPDNFWHRFYRFVFVARK